MLCFEFKFNQPVFTTLQYANSQTVSSYDIIFYGMITGVCMTHCLLCFISSILPIPLFTPFPNSSPITPSQTHHPHREDTISDNLYSRGGSFTRRRFVTDITTEEDSTNVPDNDTTTLTTTSTITPPVTTATTTIPTTNTNVKR